jgi:replicative DNA helicase
MSVESKIPATSAPTAPPPGGAPSLQAPPSQTPSPSAKLTPPHAIGAEKSILSSMLSDGEEYIGKAVEQKLGADHFYLPAHTSLFEVMLEFYHANTAVELIGLTQSLADRGLLDKIGGPQAVYEIYTYAPNAGHFDRHLQLVKDKFILRSIILTANESIADAQESPEDVPQLLDTVESKVLAIRDAAESNADVSIGKTVKDALAYIEDMLSGSGHLQGISSGYKDLDRLTNGLKPGEMFVIAARPSMGKTSLAMNIVEHVCLDQNTPTLVFSCEMTSVQLVQRLLFSRSGFHMSKVRDGQKATKEEIKRMIRVSKEISQSKLFLDDTPGITIHEVRAKARRRKHDDDIGLIAIDYLQLMRSRSRQAENSREREISEISAGIKGIAKELEVPIIVLAQLNRGPESRTGSKLGLPRLSDLRESGSIEQDADLVGLLYRADYYKDKTSNDDEEEGENDDDGKAELIIAKNRNGQTNSVPLTFLAELMRFEARAHEEESRG